MLPSLRKLMGEEKGEFYSRLSKQRETGHFTGRVIVRVNEW